MSKPETDTSQSAVGASGPLLIGWRVDVLMIAVLVGTAVLIAWPVLRDGVFTYLDNPPHLAEVYAGAFEARNGWSDTAFAGFPVHGLHSPLAYGALRVWVRLGAPLEPLYALLVLVGFLAPAIALYGVARRRLGPLASGAAAYLLLVQRPAIVGVGSALGGMWTFYLATGAFILLADRLTRPCRSRRDVAWIAGLVGFVLLTHLFLGVPLIVLAALRLVWGSERGRALGMSIVWQGVGAVLGLMAAAVYWLPYVLASDYLVVDPQHLSPWMVFARLLIPTRILALVYGDAPSLTPAAVLAGLPMILLVAAGIVGGVGRVVAYWGHTVDSAASVSSVVARRHSDRLPIYGISLAVVVLILVGWVSRADATWLGPASWRMIYFARVGFALSALALLVARCSRIEASVRWPHMMVIAVAALGLALWWNAPLRRIVTPRGGQEVAEVRALWQWIAENRKPEWGRVYLQDTFMTAPLTRRLRYSHLLTLTSHYTGIRQLGAMYGVAPYQTSQWTTAEFGMIYRRHVDTDERQRLLVTLMEETNATHLVTADRRVAAQLTDTELFVRLARVGRFDVLGRVGGVDTTGASAASDTGGSADTKGASDAAGAGVVASRWIEPLDDGASGAVMSYETGRIVVETDASHDGGAFRLRSAYHLFWRVRGGGNARLSSSPIGLMRLDVSEPGKQKVELEYDPPRWPFGFSVAGWLAIAALAYRRSRRVVGSSF